MLKKMKVMAIALIASLLFSVLYLSLSPVQTARAGYPTGHDNTTSPAHLMSWTHADPNTGDPPGSGSDNYYYLKAYAAGPTVYCEVYTGGYWDIALETSSKVVLSELKTDDSGGRVYISNGVTGNLYFCRIANIGTAPEKDYAELNSGPTGNTTTSDCGGPGPVVDPNFNEQPMEPAPTQGMPVNGCSNPTTAPYSAGDPRLVFPPSQVSFDLGGVVSGHTYQFDTTRSGDLTAFAFVGHQGSSATINITNCSGTTVNGAKWGAKTPNPMTMNQEFVGADAGEQPAGCYQVRYTGPTNNQEMYAINGEA